MYHFPLPKGSYAFDPLKTVEQESFEGENYRDLVEKWRKLCGLFTRIIPPTTYCPPWLKILAEKTSEIRGSFFFLECFPLYSNILYETLTYVPQRGQVELFERSGMASSSRWQGDRPDHVDTAERKEEHHCAQCVITGAYLLTYIHSKLPQYYHYYSRLGSFRH